MNSNQIMKADILDIVFENRNKAYGAYVLRKFYPNRLKLAMGFMLIIAAAFSVFTLLPEKGRDLITKPFIFTETEFTDVIAEPEVPIKKPEAENTPAKETVPFDQKKMLTNIAIVPNTVKTDIVSTLLPTDNIGADNIDNPKSVPALVVPVNPQTGNGGSGKIAPAIDINTPMDADAVDIRPSFPGGLDALKKFLEKHLHNPYDLENGETINVQIRFVVGYSGRLQGFSTVVDGGEIYNKEVIRVLKKMPDWLPGKAKGENVSVYYTIPVKFVMSN